MPLPPSLQLSGLILNMSDSRARPGPGGESGHQASVRHFPGGRSTPLSQGGRAVVTSRMTPSQSGLPPKKGGLGWAPLYLASPSLLTLSPGLPVAPFPSLHLGGARAWSAEGQLKVRANVRSRPLGSSPAGPSSPSSCRAGTHRGCPAVEPSQKQKRPFPESCCTLRVRSVRFCSGGLLAAELLSQVPLPRKPASCLLETCLRHDLSPPEMFHFPIR